MSFQFDYNPIEDAGSEAIHNAGRELQLALIERQAEEKFTQQDIADMLNVDKSRITKCLSGFNNLTLRTFGELAYVMDYDIEFKLVRRGAAAKEIRREKVPITPVSRHARIIHTYTDPNVVNKMEAA